MKSKEIKSAELTQAQEYVYYLLKSGHKINFNPEGTDPVYDKDGKLVTRLSFKTMRAMMRKKVIDIVNYEYVLL